MKRIHTHSQNFLRTPRTVKILLGHSTIKKTDTVIDIGAGSGVITAILAEHCAHVIAIENEKRAFEKLRSNLKNHNNVSLFYHDILTLQLPETPYKVFANIPFHLSSPIIRKLTEAPAPPKAIYLIVQKQFAQKLCMDTTSFTSLLGASIAPLYTVRIRYSLEKSDFTPPPAVDTRFIELLLRDTPLIEPARLGKYRAFVEKCFSRQKFFETLAVTKRPSELSTEEWVELFNRHDNEKRPSQ